MEITNVKELDEQHVSLPANQPHDNPLLISCNWQISNNKQFVDAIITAPIRYAPARINYEDVASVDTSIALKPMDSELDSNATPCMLDIKVTNCQKIARIAIVSEGNVLEIFKQFGEYATTIFAEFIDEYEGNVVFLGETMIHPPTTEIKIKFTRTKNKDPFMWIYGIKLFLKESTNEAKHSAFNYDIIQTFLNNTSNSKTNQRSELAKRIFGIYDKQDIAKNYKEKHSKIQASDLKYSSCTNKTEISNNEKVFPNCTDNYEYSSVTECNRVERKNGTEYLSCEENDERSSADVKTCIDNNTESVKETKSNNPFNYKNFIRTFLSNFDNDKMNQEFNMTGSCDDEIIRNGHFYQKVLETLTSDRDLYKFKNKVEKRDDEKNNRNDEADYEKLDSFKCKNRHLEKNSNEECTNCKEHKKSDIDLKLYIDNKFHDIEKKLMKRIDKIEASTNQKLDAILKRLETRLNLQ